MSTTAPRIFGPDARYEHWRWRTFGITWLAYAGFYLTRKSFPVAKIGLENLPDVPLTSEQMGSIDSAGLIAYAIGQYAWGIAGDRFGPRKVVLTGMLLSTLVAFSMGYTTLALILGILNFLQGLCQSSGWAPLTKNVSAFFSQRERGVIMGFWCTNYALGGFIASLLASYAVSVTSDYRYAFFVPAITLLGVWVLFIFLQRNRPEDVGLTSIEEYHGEKPAVLDEEETPDEEPEGSWKVILEVLSSPMVWLLAGVYFFVKPTRYAVLLWGPVFVHDKLGSEVFESAAISSLFELVGPVSVIAAGFISDRVFGSRRMPVIVIGMFGLALLLFSIGILPPSRLLLGTYLMGIGLLIFGPDALISGTAAIDFGTKKGAATAAGLINGCGSLGAIIGGYVPGYLRDNYGWGWIFALLGCCSLAAALLLLPQWNALPTTAEDRENNTT